MEWQTKAELKNSLADTLKEWLANTEGLPYVGDSMALIMAEAALLPLEAVADTQRYLSNEGMFEDKYAYENHREAMQRVEDD